MAGLITRLRQRAADVAAEDPGFDPGKPGQPSATYSFALRQIDLLARSFLIKRPEPLRNLIKFLIRYYSNPGNIAGGKALTPQEAQDLAAKFLRTKEPEVEVEPEEA